MLEMVSLTFLLPRRLTCFSLRRDTVRSHTLSLSSLLIILDLIQYCIREKVPFTEFEDWNIILSTVKDIVEGKTDVKAVAKQGVEAAEEGK